MSSDGQDLHELCVSGSVQDIEAELTSSKGRHINLLNDNGLRPLHLAVQRKTDDIISVLDLLIKHKADLNARTLGDEDTALHIVLRYAKLDPAEEIVLKLLENGADPDIRNGRLRSPFDYAVDRGYVELAKVLSGEVTLPKAAKDSLLRRKHYWAKQLIASIMAGNNTDFQEAIKKADVNFINEFGAGAIHYTVTHCPPSLSKMEVLESLVTAGANVSLTDHEGDTALNLVIKTDSLRADDMMYLLAGRLLEWGCDQSLRDIDGHNASDLAKKRHYDDIESLLRSHGGENVVSQTNAPPPTSPRQS